MANLKLDLVNKIGNKKYYDEIELIRLAQEPNMNYNEKLDLMDNLLKNIAIVNIQIGLVNEVYFKEPEGGAQAPLPAGAQQVAPAAEAPKTKIQPGQSHGE